MRANTPRGGPMAGSKEAQGGRSPTIKSEPAHVLSNERRSPFRAMPTSHTFEFFVQAAVHWRLCDGADENHNAEVTKVTVGHDCVIKAVLYEHVHKNPLYFITQGGGVIETFDGWQLLIKRGGTLLCHPIPYAQFAPESDPPTWYARVLMEARRLESKEELEGVRAVMCQVRAMEEEKRRRKLEKVDAMRIRLEGMGIYGDHLTRLGDALEAEQVATAMAASSMAAAASGTDEDFALAVQLQDEEATAAAAATGTDEGGKRESPTGSLMRSPGEASRAPSAAALTPPDKHWPHVGGRPKAGDRVQIIDSSPSGKSNTGRLEPMGIVGLEGELVEDDGSERPFRVRLLNSAPYHELWFMQSQVVTLQESLFSPSTPALTPLPARLGSFHSPRWTVLKRQLAELDKRVGQLLPRCSTHSTQAESGCSPSTQGESGRSPLTPLSFDKENTPSSAHYMIDAAAGYPLSCDPVGRRLVGDTPPRPELVW